VFSVIYSSRLRQYDRSSPQSGQVQVMLLHVKPQRSLCIQKSHIASPHEQVHKKSLISWHMGHLPCFLRFFRSLDFFIDACI
ncbi:MAG: hypothetical protein V1754_07080, partial [Pseudomonadota bacterium]